jgi:hypothetical protein
MKTRQQNCFVRGRRSALASSSIRCQRNVMGNALGWLRTTSTLTRTMENDVYALRVTNPITGKLEKLNVLLADLTEMDTCT